MTLVFLLAAAVTVGEAKFQTYPYSDPDPVPATAEKRYPYFRFDGSTTQAVEKAWRTVTLESDRMALTFLPDLGGKLWGDLGSAAHLAGASGQGTSVRRRAMSNAVR